jgi:hypothetical protein
MADEQSTEILRELRRIRLALCGLIAVLSIISFTISMHMWSQSLRPPETHSFELQGIQGELRAIRTELSMQGAPRLPPLPIQSVAPPKAAASNTKLLLLGKWKHENGKTVITLEFTADKVSYRNNRPDAGPPGETPYKVLDDKTLEMPHLGVAPLTEKVAIDSLSAEKLVLSGGGTWKFDKTAFTKQP